MKAFRKINLILTTVVLCFGCTIVFSQDKQSAEKKNKETKQKQEEVFDVNNATLEDAQSWFKKTLFEYGKYTSSFPNVTFKGRVEKVQFKGCEISYTRSLLTEGLRSNSSAPPTNASVRENMAATDFRTLFNNYNESKATTKVNLTKLDVNKTEIVDKGIVFWIQVFTLADSKNNLVEEKVSSIRPPFDARDSVPPLKSPKYSMDGAVFIVNDKEIANQIKDVLSRMITLCQ